MMALHSLNLKQTSVISDSDAKEDWLIIFI